MMDGDGESSNTIAGGDEHRLEEDNENDESLLVSPAKSDNAGSSPIDTLTNKILKLGNPMEQRRTTTQSTTIQPLLYIDDGEIEFENEQETPLHSNTSGTGASFRLDSDQREAETYPEKYISSSHSETSCLEMSKDGIDVIENMSPIEMVPTPTQKDQTISDGRRRASMSLQHSTLDRSWDDVSIASDLVNNDDEETPFHPRENQRSSKDMEYHDLPTTSPSRYDHIVASTAVGSMRSTIFATEQMKQTMENSHDLLFPSQNTVKKRESQFNDLNSKRSGPSHLFSTPQLDCSLEYSRYTPNPSGDSLSPLGLRALEEHDRLYAESPKIFNSESISLTSDQEGKQTQSLVSATTDLFRNSLSLKESNHGTAKEKNGTVEKKNILIENKGERSAHAISEQQIEKGQSLRSTSPVAVSSPLRESASHSQSQSDIKLTSELLDSRAAAFLAKLQGASRRRNQYLLPKQESPELEYLQLPMPQIHTSTAQTKRNARPFNRPEQKKAAGPNPYKPFKARPVPPASRASTGMVGQLGLPKVEKPPPTKATSPLLGHRRKKGYDGSTLPASNRLPTNENKQRNCMESKKLHHKENRFSTETSKGKQQEGLSKGFNHQTSKQLAPINRNTNSTSFVRDPMSRKSDALPIVLEHQRKDKVRYSAPPLFRKSNEPSLAPKLQSTDRAERRRIFESQKASKMDEERERAHRERQAQIKAAEVELRNLGKCLR